MHDLTLSNSLADFAARIKVEHRAVADALNDSLKQRSLFDHLRWRGVP
jgi:hypothetical protein